MEATNPNTGSGTVSFIAYCADDAFSNMSQWTPNGLRTALGLGPAPSHEGDSQPQSSPDIDLGDYDEEDDYDDSDKDPDYVPPPPKVPKPVPVKPSPPTVHKSSSLPRAQTFTALGRPVAAPKHKRNKSSISHSTKTPVRLTEEQVAVLVANASNTSGLLGDNTAARAAKLKALKANFRLMVTKCGDDEAVWCLSCYHPGHKGEDDGFTCPVARLKVYIYGEFKEPHLVGTKTDAFGTFDFFFSDFALVVEGHKWAMSTMKDGNGSSFGIAVEHLRKSAAVLERCQQLAREGWFLGQEGVDYEYTDVFVSRRPQTARFVLS
jgi:hypothetical protein